MSKLTYVTNEYGGWAGIFVDDILEDEGHEIPTHIWLYYLESGRITSVNTAEVSGEWMEDVGSFPKQFEEIPEEVFV